ncbi:uncharacterized protein LTR77_005858 [Saxophila tyrrhenica]|uniref:Uncharacterized protein n=1 Tax=Saxophila tyrrhenica TaxID=1690608 RepID=A0AAV9PDS3_9PEZI|nr:hypothetical protein LTR77_005858 [Saxophila tyrrhenica]
MTVNAPAPPSFVNRSTNSLPQHDTVSELQPPPTAHVSARRGSYICLPDDPIGGMPRSRTFSNLPLPTRGKKAHPIAASKSHARLPSAALPSSRLPSPQMSNRKHSHSRLFSVDAKPPAVRNRMKRSDTEPLLGVNDHQSSLLPRSTAFKENISLSPIKPLPALDISSYRQRYPSPVPRLPYSGRPREISVNHQQPSVSTNASSSPPMPHDSGSLKLAPAHEHKSSPIHSNISDRRIAPLAPVQRYNSQPVLTSNNNITSRRDSQHGEIKQTRLMSARPPPTPPLAKAPLRSSQSRNLTGISAPGKSSGQSSKLEQPSFLSRSTGRRAKAVPPSPAKPSKSSLQIRNAEPPAYWSGRLSSLLDRYRNEELAGYTTQGPMSTPKAQTDKMHTPEASTARIHRAFDHLSSLCVSQEAKESLARFQCQYAEVMKLPELRKVVPIVLGSSSSLGRETEVVDEEAALGMGEMRKISFMDRLLGRQKRRSLVMV